MKKIVVLGAGFGGLFSVINLCKYWEDFKVTLINRDNNFTFTPLLHEVATAGIRENNAIYPLEENLTDRRVEVVKANVDKIDLSKRVVFTSGGEFKYDYLVIALGSRTNFHNTKGVENCLELKTINDARKIKKNVVEIFKIASKTKDVSERRKLLTMVVIGAGPTGIEFAAELKDFGDMLIKRKFRNIKESEFSVIVLHKYKDMLPQLPRSLVTSVENKLKRLGVDLRYNCVVDDVRKEGIVVDKKLIPCAIKVAAIGVMPNKITAIPDIYNEIGIDVKKTLQVNDLENVFALGDVAVHKNKDGSITPRLAQAAIEEAKIVAGNIINLIRGKKLKEFEFKRKGFLLSVGPNFAVAEIFGIKFKGFFAWWLWRTIYMTKVLSIKNKLYLAYDWTVGLFRRRFIDSS